MHALTLKHNISHIIVLRTIGVDIIIKKHNK